MPGKWITENQIRLYMQSRQKGKSQQAAAAQAAFCERSARNIEARFVEHRNRSWKTRKDPFESVWESELVPLLEIHPKLEARTLLEELQRRYEGFYPDNLLRTLQRRVKKWKAISGPDKEVIFRQNHPPGWQGISDFTNANQLGVSICGERLSHLFYHFRLPYSGFEYVQVVLGGESFTALAEGMQNAFWCAYGVPQTHRTDSLSAAFKNSKDEFTESYSQLCEYYGTEPTRNNKGVSHENGSIESPHGHLKNKISQALMLRGSTDFSSLDEYRAFVREVALRHNKRIEKALIEERAFLKPLPERRTCDYEEERIRVTSSSTIVIKGVTYSVPSRLIGMILKIHLYDDRLECFVGADHVIALQRLRKRKRCRQIDYRHVIGTLVKKPQAFRNYIYREELFPTLAFRQAWEMLDKELDSRRSCQEYVKILNEAIKGEEQVNTYLENCLKENHLPKSDQVKSLFKDICTSLPLLRESTCDLSGYDVLLGGSK
jgi:hypothetical protein